MSLRSNNIRDLYFGVMIWDFNKRGLAAINLFGSYRAMRAVAYYTVYPERYAKLRQDELLLALFGDTWGRAEWEFLVEGWPPKGRSEKRCVYDMYVEPNKEYLLDLVANVSVNSAKKWLKEHINGRRI